MPTIEQFARKGRNFTDNLDDQKCTQLNASMTQIAYNEDESTPVVNTDIV